MRRLFTLAEAAASGLTRSALRWGEPRGRWRRIDYAVYAEGADEPDRVDLARARVLASRGIGRLAAMMHRLDGVEEPDHRPLRQRVLPRQRVVVIEGVPCTDGHQTLVDLAADLDDLQWEQALDCALRKRLTSVGDIEAALPGPGRMRTPGARRMRRVLAARRDAAPPTESLLETLMVQLVRGIAGLPEPTRQHVVVDEWGSFVARVDLSWPELGLFLELDGQHHEGQPLYDARRETAVVAATGWLPGRFTWHEVVSIPTTTARRLVALAEQAHRRLGRVRG
jgi:very-short-patch-repair endonuclease